MKKSLNKTFINSNTEEQIVQAMLEVFEYNLDKNDKILKFDYKDTNSYQSFRKKTKDHKRYLPHLH